MLDVFLDWNCLYLVPQTILVIKLIVEVVGIQIKGNYKIIRTLNAVSTWFDDASFFGLILTPKIMVMDL
jgi:hypothetical protein